MTYEQLGLSDPSFTAHHSVSKGNVLSPPGVPGGPILAGQFWAHYFKVAA